jgi:hypothetical protein
MCVCTISDGKTTTTYRFTLDIAGHEKMRCKIMQVSNSKVTERECTHSVVMFVSEFEVCVRI